MTILIIGSGARESALGQAWLRSKGIAQVYVAPGNDGMSRLGLTPVAIDELDFPRLIAFARQHAVTLTFVGPEAPLAAGIVDAFTAAGLTIFGPNQQTARLEASKRFAKAFMRRWQLPTASAVVAEDLTSAQAAVRRFGLPVVIKADGLAAGKGVVVAETAEQANETLRRLFTAHQTTAVIEEFLSGEEASVLALYNGSKCVLFPLAQDHKRRYDGDGGPNTGGMGAVSPAPQFSAAQWQAAADLVDRTLAGMVAEGLTGTGVLYIGLMFTATGPKILEYNLRFGDPETQVLLPQVTNDWATLIAHLMAGQADALQLDGQTYCGVVAAHPNYPGKTQPAVPVQVPDDACDYWYPAGVKASPTGWQSHGGRIVTVVGQGDDLGAARRQAYERLADWQGDLAVRQDIGVRALRGEV